VPNDPTTEKLVESYAAAIGSGDPERVWPHYADNIVYEDCAVQQIHYGLTAVKHFFLTSMTALNVTWLVDTVIATEEGFALAWRMTGSHDLDLPGMPATGKAFTVPGASIAEVRRGKIVRNRDFWNNQHLLAQLGFA
jgi:steroid delta-isomerase-like uncharacterized protein